MLGTIKQIFFHNRISNHLFVGIEWKGYLKIYTYIYLHWPPDGPSGLKTGREEKLTSWANLHVGVCSGGFNFLVLMPILGWGSFHCLMRVAYYAYYCVTDLFIINWTGQRTKNITKINESSKFKWATNSYSLSYEDLWLVIVLISSNVLHFIGRPISNITTRLHKMHNNIKYIDTTFHWTDKKGESNQKQQNLHKLYKKLYRYNTRKGNLDNVQKLCFLINDVHWSSCASKARKSGAFETHQNVLYFY